MSDFTIPVSSRRVTVGDLRRMLKDETLSDSAVVFVRVVRRRRSRGGTGSAQLAVEYPITGNIVGWPDGHVSIIADGGG